MSPLSSNATRVLQHFADQNAFEGGFILAPELLRLFATDQECIEAQAELFRHGMLMLQASPSTRACHAALTPLGVETIGRLSSK
jgi:threonine synthase